MLCWAVVGARRNIACALVRALSVLLWTVHRVAPHMSGRYTASYQGIIRLGFSDDGDFLSSAPLQITTWWGKWARPQIHRYACDSDG
ncbi:hypothetical protein F5Y17DRAFT_61820 [Xylariaceae sp. FL0594]|nr:hypothetical protein F5Y17DRAFT_61820 [Xylariaceae sp. FL0594]